MQQAVQAAGSLDGEIDSSTISVATVILPVTSIIPTSSNTVIVVKVQIKQTVFVK